MPARSSLARLWPKPDANGKPLSSSANSARRPASVTPWLSSAWARSTAAACVECTTYTGAWWVATSWEIVSWIGSSDHAYDSGTGRVTPPMTAVGRSVVASRRPASLVTSPSVADMITNCACGSSTSGTCQAQPRSGSAMKWNSSMTTWPTSASAPSRRAMLARISAVQHTIGASPLTEASPVTMPTFAAPKVSTSAKNFSLTSALMGAV